ncbi:hypothetical protein [Bradyrhizobium sp. dw_78]|uniref:hypothetical protein n=1 Tax=Bradyrhizobium sp. dw_78 TaxID=2719793 RepID=UPI00201BEF74|nr:hypothetical protein [Bradyrhizobium sp. dw_78]
MGTIIEFPADAAVRRQGSAKQGSAGQVSARDGAPGGTTGTVLILPVIRIERAPEATSGGHGPEQGTAPRRRRRRR